MGSVDSAVIENEALSGMTEIVADADTDTVGTILFSLCSAWQLVKANKVIIKTVNVRIVFLIIFPPLFPGEEKYT